MNRSFRPTVVAAILLALVAVPHAKTPPVTPEDDPVGEAGKLPEMARVQVEFIEVSHAQYTELMFGAKTSANDTALRATLAGLAKEGKATVVETLVVTAKSGQKAVSESIEEIIYATEYEPPEMPNRVEPGEDDKDPGTPMPELALPPTPSAWDTRNTGGTLEVEPTWGADRIIDLRLVPEIVYHVGNSVWMEWKDSRGTSNIEMANFYTLRFNAAVFLVSGQPLMAAALSPKDDQGKTDPTRKLMVFVRADIITVGK